VAPATVAAAHSSRQVSQLLARPGPPVSPERVEWIDPGFSGWQGGERRRETGGHGSGLRSAAALAEVAASRPAGRTGRQGGASGSSGRRRATHARRCLVPLTLGGTTRPRWGWPHKEEDVTQMGADGVEFGWRRCRGRRRVGLGLEGRTPGLNRELRVRLGHLRPGRGGEGGQGAGERPGEPEQQAALVQPTRLSCWATPASRLRARGRGRGRLADPDGFRGGVRLRRRVESACLTRSARPGWGSAIARSPRWGAVPVARKTLPTGAACDKKRWDTREVARSDPVATARVSGDGSEDYTPAQSALFHNTGSPGDRQGLATAPPVHHRTQRPEGRWLRYSIRLVVNGSAGLRRRCTPRGPRGCISGPRVPVANVEDRQDDDHQEHETERVGGVGWPSLTLTK